MTNQIPAGWYPDPNGQGERWWDGSAWSEHTRAGAAAQPAQPAQPQVPAGWYPDPSGGDGQRWWDGTQWTEHVHPAPASDATAAPDATATEAAEPTSTTDEVVVADDADPGSADDAGVGGVAAPADERSAPRAAAGDLGAVVTPVGGTTGSTGGDVTTSEPDPAGAGDGSEATADATPPSGTGDVPVMDQATETVTTDTAATATDPSGVGQAAQPEIPAGWYPDPSGGEGQRWWDGGQWTEHVHPPEGGTATSEQTATTSQTSGDIPPGWYPDPNGQGERWWDGTQWSEHVRPTSG